MPRWGIHLEIAKRINKNNKYDKNEFLFGNVLPDIQDGYIVKDISNITNHLESHYYDGINKTYDKFCEYNKEIINENVSIGYLTHLLTDYYFNQTFYKKLTKVDDHKVSLKLLNGEEILAERDIVGIVYKQHDFKVFEKYIMKNYEPKVPNYESNLVIKSNLIGAININDKDVKNVIHYLKKEMKDDIINDSYLVYTNEELVEIMNESEKFILEYLESLMVEK